MGSSMRKNAATPVSAAAFCITLKHGHPGEGVRLRSGPGLEAYFGENIPLACRSPDRGFLAVNSLPSMGATAHITSPSPFHTSCLVLHRLPASSELCCRSSVPTGNLPVDRSASAADARSYG